MDLDAATDELYALAPDAFLPRRAELVAAARAAGDRELAAQIGGLRKPTVAAWAVNRVIRTVPDDVGRLTDLAARLRSAQQSLDGSALKSLGRERATLVDALVHATVAGARSEGVPLSATAARDAADTFVAALASPKASAAVTSGRLTRTLTYAGFGDVDLHDATARPLRVVPDPSPHEDAESDADAEPDQDPGPEQDGAAGPECDDPALTAAQAALHTAVAAATGTASRRFDAAAELERAEARVGELTRKLATARAERDVAADALAEAEIADEAAQRRAEASRDVLGKVRAEGKQRRGGHRPR